MVYKTLAMWHLYSKTVNNMKWMKNERMLEISREIQTMIQFIFLMPFCTTYICNMRHCSYLDNYISQNIRFCKGDFEGQFQTSLQARIMILFSENSYPLSISTHFLIFFSRSCQIHAVAAITISWHFWVAIWWKNMTQTYQPFCNFLCEK